MKAGKKLKLAFLGLLLLLFCWQVVQAPWFFTVQQIRVEGAALLSPWEVERIAGIGRGMSLLRLDVSRVQLRLEADPRISQARVQRRIPGTLRIVVEENTGVAALPYFNAWVEVDKQGRVLAVSNQFSSFNLPIVTGLNHGMLTVGARLPDNSGWKVATELLEAMPPELLNQISEINVSDDKQLVLYTRDPLRIVIGDTRNLTQKISALHEMLGQVRQEQRTALATGVLDVSSGRAVFVNQNVGR